MSSEPGYRTKAEGARSASRSTLVAAGGELQLLDSTVPHEKERDRFVARKRGDHPIAEGFEVNRLQ